ncbi:hypothetical protein [Trinickia symbiotica]|uniref:hypothetical protein n=1 Tax=Trinickia symbiotica TaxID=863227 RepID=UPI00167BCE28|nr:hypothetical protein [Trinickia symbiotica]
MRGAAVLRYSAIGASHAEKTKNIVVTLRPNEKKSPDITHPLSFFQRLRERCRDAATLATRIAAAKISIIGQSGRSVTTKCHARRSAANASIDECKQLSTRFS